jgi:group I intron endonuclease
MTKENGGANLMYIFTYITTNNVNGKQYVGMHVTNNIDDRYLGSGKILYDSIKKYGKENFSRDIVNMFSSTIDAHSDEEKLIKQYNTISPYGYNISPSGGTHASGKHSEESNEKNRKSHLGKLQTDETKRKKSDIQKIKGGLII